MSRRSTEHDDGLQNGRHSSDAEGATAERMTSPLWFDDGSVVLVAEQSKFRVHSSILSRHCPGLKELFAIPRTSETEHLSGCPVFHLSDTAEDLEYLLQLIYDAPRYALNFHYIYQDRQ